MNEAEKSILSQAFRSAKENKADAVSIEADIQKVSSLFKTPQEKEKYSRIYRATGRIIQKTQTDINNIAEYTGMDKNAVHFSPAD